MKKKVPQNKNIIKNEENLSSSLKEPDFVYQTQYDIAMNDPFTMMEVVRNGVSKNKLIALASKMDVSVSELADILHISLRTIQRYDDFDKLDSHTSEHVMLIDRLYRKGHSNIFSSPQAFNDWMKRDLFDFNYQKPISLIDTYSGIEAVFDKLGQFEHGVFA